MAQSQAESHHPDLTAMLDVVMQLLLYFIFTARLINEEVNAGDVHLPMSQAARPVTASDSDLLFVHVMADGKVYTAHDKPVVKNLDDTRYWLQKVANEEMSKKGKIDLAVVIRADRDASYESVYRVMGVCKEKKFTRFKLRAFMGGSS
jgi:biopolymer transport protein ExbD